MSDQPKNRACGQVRVYGIAQDHRHAHGRRRDQEANAWMARLDDLRRPDEQLAVVTRANQFLQSFLNIPSEFVGIQVVDPTVHESEAIGRANDSID